jgi:hypothetical protein
LYDEAPEVVDNDLDQVHTSSTKPDTSWFREDGISNKSTMTGFVKQQRNRRVGDMKPFTFWLLIAIVCLVVVGAAIGGSVASVMVSRDGAGQSSG